MTIQNIFDRMMLLDNQLDLISGGDDVTRGLVAVNMAQDWLEAEAAAIGNCLSQSLVVSTTANQYFSYAVSDIGSLNLLRLDRVVLLNGTSFLQEYELDYVEHGSIVHGTTSPYGKPEICSWPGPSISAALHWDPIPDAVYSMVVYGFWAQADYTAAANTFAHSGNVALPIVWAATKVLKIGLDRDLASLQNEAQSFFRNVLKGLAHADRSHPLPRVYSEVHEV